MVELSMAVPKPHCKVKLIIGMLSSRIELFDLAKKHLVELYGEIDLETALIDFEHTDYYNDELGEKIKRKFLSFAELIEPTEIVEIKHKVSEIENIFRNKDRNNNRSINLDPGYITLSKLILSTYKDYSHRIYLGDKVYAESTLKYVGSTFQPFEYTYPDYRSQEYINFFNKVRQIYRLQLRT